MAPSGCIYDELMLGTRFSSLNTHPIPGGDGQPSGAFVLDAQEALGDSLAVVLMHPKCCGGTSEELSRQETVYGGGLSARRNGRQRLVRRRN